MPRNRDIPRKFHYVWVGGDLPETYLRNIKTVASLAGASGIAVHLWVDNKNNYYHKIAKQFELSVPNLKIRKIQELPERLANVSTENRYAYDSAHYPGPSSTGQLCRTVETYLHPKMIKKLLLYVQYEMIGFKNYAAASDILRVLILYLEGGYYFDTDLVPQVDWRLAKPKITLPQATEGLLILPNSLDELSILCGLNNCALGAAPYHDALIDLLYIICRRYDQLYGKDRQCEDYYGSFRKIDRFKLKTELSPEDYKDREGTRGTEFWGHWYDRLTRKRMPGSHGSQRVRVTLSTSGPAMLYLAAGHYVDKGGKSIARKLGILPSEHSICFAVEHIMAYGAWEQAIRLGDLTFLVKCDATWLTPAATRQRSFSIDF